MSSIHVAFSGSKQVQPDVPAGKWFKRFPGMTVCGEGEWVKTFLTAAQTPIGEQVG